jgi:hypothetical protein
MLIINRETQNLRDMALAEVVDARRGAEVAAMTGISDTADRTAEALEGFLVLAAIHQSMTSEKDMALVAGYASIALEGTKHKLDIVVPLISQQLMHVKAPAAIAEAERLRDRMQDLRQELDRYSY